MNSTQTKSRITNLLKIAFVIFSLLLIYPVLATATTCSTIYCTLDHNEFRLNNNKWGQPGATQNIFVNDDVIGWSWNNPGGGWNFPEVTIGTDFGNWRPSTSPSFPVLYKNLNTFTAEIAYKYTQKPTGSWSNLGYDIYWLDNSGSSTSPWPGKTKKYNIMIWVNGGANLVGSSDVYVKDVNDGYNTYGYYRGNRGWPWEVFVLKNQVNPVQGTTYTHKVNIKALMSAVTGTLDGNWVIPDLQLGSENENGDGRIEISKYNVEVNGRLSQLSTTSPQTSNPIPVPTQPIVIPSSTPSPTPAGNLLLNPGFESGTTIPDSWWTYQTRTGAIYSYPGIGRTTGESVSIKFSSSNGKGNWGQHLNVIPSRQYDLSGWIKTSNISGSGASIVIDWFDSSNNYLSTSRPVRNLVGTNNWIYLQGSAISPSNAASANILGQLAYSSGEAYFDDILFKLV